MWEKSLAPTRYTKPLSENMVSDGPMLRQFVRMAWSTPQGPMELDQWQADLIDSILERYPDDWPEERLRGRLRYRQVVVSMPRQQGKSVIGAVLGLYGLLFHMKGPYVVGIASNKEQANVIYQRVLHVINSNPVLAARFARLTDTRGISNADKSSLYEMKAAKGAALQGLPITLCLFDELHISKVSMWSAVVLGTTTMKDGLVLGITTAGDDNSELLKNLYATGDQALAGLNERFGFFVWEAPTDEVTESNVLACNPAIHAGRISLEDTMSDIRSMPESEAIRYRLNRFVAASYPWIPYETWAAASGGKIAGGKLFISIDRTPSWGNASIVAAAKDDGVVQTELIASISKPTEEQLLEIARTLYSRNPTWVVDSYSLKSLGKSLEMEGQQVVYINGADVVNACQRAYALIATDKLKHDGSELLTFQSSRAIKKSVGQHWRIARNEHDIDAVMALVYASYIAETDKDLGIQIW